MIGGLQTPNHWKKTVQLCGSKRMCSCQEALNCRQANKGDSQNCELTSPESRPQYIHAHKLKAISPKKNKISYKGRMWTRQTNGEILMLHIAVDASV